MAHPVVSRRAAIAFVRVAARIVQTGGLGVWVWQTNDVAGGDEGVTVGDDKIEKASVVEVFVTEGALDDRNGLFDAASKIFWGLRGVMVLDEVEEEGEAQGGIARAVGDSEIKSGVVEGCKKAAAEMSEGAEHAVVHPKITAEAEGMASSLGHVEAGGGSAHVGEEDARVYLLGYGA